MRIAASFRRLMAPPVYRSLGIDIFGKHRWLSEVGQWSPAKREEWRLAKLNAMLEHCWAHVLFYQRYWADHGLQPQPVRHLEELARYPVLPRDLFKAHRDELVPDTLAGIPHKSDSTGGTTGSPLKYFHDLELHALRYACQMIGWGFAGYQFADEVFLVSGGSLVAGKSTFRNAARGWLEAKHGLYCLQMDDALARACWQAMRQQGTKLLVGYPSTLSLLCSSLKRQQLPLTGLKAVVTTAEMLLPHYRAAIEDHTGVKVFDHYGCNDGGLLSYECERHEGLHYNDFESVLEVIEPDGAGVGELAITNLWNRSMPFVRYLNGDLLNLVQEPCPCGRRYPLIGRVQGRTADILSFPNGKNLTGPGVTLIFKDLAVEAWQAVQTGPDTLEIRIRSGARLAASQEHYIHQVLQQHLGDGCRVAIRYVDAFAVTRGGKLKPVFSEWNPGKTAPV